MAAGGTGDGRAGAPIRVGVIADTHIADARRQLPEQALRAFEGVYCILHAGDVLTQAVLDRLAAIAPVHAVFGNCDPPEFSWRLPDKLVVDVAGVRIGLTHGHLGGGGDTPEQALAYLRDEPDLRVVVFGHSHQPYNALHGGVLLFNPGSATQRRRAPYPSYGLLELREGLCSGTIVYLR
jgi:putative phosphoesterase